MKFHDYVRINTSINIIFEFGHYRHYESSRSHQSYHCVVLLEVESGYSCSRFFIDCHATCWGMKYFQGSSVFQFASSSNDKKKTELSTKISINSSFINYVISNSFELAACSQQIRKWISVFLDSEGHIQNSCAKNSVYYYLNMNLPIICLRVYLCQDYAKLLLQFRPKQINPRLNLLEIGSLISHAQILCTCTSQC